MSAARDASDVDSDEQEARELDQKAEEHFKAAGKIALAARNDEEFIKMFVDHNAGNRALLRAKQIREEASKRKHKHISKPTTRTKKAQRKSTAAAASRSAPATQARDDTESESDDSSSVPALPQPKVPYKVGQIFYIFIDGRIRRFIVTDVNSTKPLDDREKYTAHDVMEPSMQVKFCHDYRRLQSSPKKLIDEAKEQGRENFMNLFKFVRHDEFFLVGPTGGISHQIVLQVIHDPQNKLQNYEITRMQSYVNGTATSTGHLMGDCTDVFKQRSDAELYVKAYGLRAGSAAAASSAPAAAAGASASVTSDSGIAVQKRAKSRNKGTPTAAPHQFVAVQATLTYESEKSESDSGADSDESNELPSPKLGEIFYVFDGGKARRILVDKIIPATSPDGKEMYHAHDPSDPAFKRKFTYPCKRVRDLKGDVFRLADQAKVPQCQEFHHFKVGDTCYHVDVGGSIYHHIITSINKGKRLNVYTTKSATSDDYVGQFRGDDAFYFRHEEDAKLYAAFLN